MGISFELIFNSLGLHNPLIGAISALMNELCGLIVVHRLDLVVCVLNIWAIDLEALDEHLLH